MRGSWRELDVEHHERDDGAAVRYAGSNGTRTGAFGWVGHGPDRTPLTTRTARSGGSGPCGRRRPLSIGRGGSRAAK